MCCVCVCPARAVQPGQPGARTCVALAIGVALFVRDLLVDTHGTESCSMTTFAQISAGTCRPAVWAGPSCLLGGGDAGHLAPSRLGKCAWLSSVLRLCVMRHITSAALLSAVTQRAGSPGSACSAGVRALVCAQGNAQLQQLCAARVRPNPDSPALASNTPCTAAPACSGAHMQQRLRQRACPDAS